MLVSSCEQNIYTKSYIESGSACFIDQKKNTNRGPHGNEFWKPKLNEKLDCLHEPDILFDIFAAQTCSGNETALGPYHVLSRAAKFLLDRGSVIVVFLSHTNHRKSPLVQGGMENPYKSFCDYDASSKKY